MSRLAVLALAAAVWVGPARLQAATARPAVSEARPAPRTAFGQPDLQGSWTNVSLTPESRAAALGDRAVYTPEEVAKIEGAAAKLEAEGSRNTDPNAPPPSVGGDRPPPGVRPEFLAAGGNVGGYNIGWLDAGSRVMRVRGEPRASVLTTPDGRAPPPKPGAPTSPFDIRQFTNFDNPETRSLGERCVMSFGRNAGPPMLANGFYNNDYQIVQTPGEVAILIEMVHDVRHIRLNADHRTDGLRPWMGDSIGRWEGETLVVETTSIPKAQAYHGAWRDLKVTERFTRLAPDRLLYAFTVEDPSVWDRPWGGEYEFHPLVGRIFEYACHEGNYALPSMLAGARHEEQGAGKTGR